MTTIGAHVSKSSKLLNTDDRNTLLDAIREDTESLKLTCCQIFTHGPANSRKNAMDYTAIKDYCILNNISLYVHSSYLTTGIWNISTDLTEKNKAAISLLISQFDCADKLNSKGLVVHTPKKTPESMIATLRVLIPLIKSYNTPLILEMTAVKPDEHKTYETPQKINNFNRLMLENFPDYINWGWCIDTCHLWSAGIDLSSKQVLQNWLDLIDPKKIKLFHLNGASTDTFNTGKDNHKVVFGSDDNIWNNEHITRKISLSNIKKSSIYMMIQFIKTHKIDIICEINRGDVNEIKYAFDCLFKLVV